MEDLKIEQVDNGFKLILNGETYYSPQYLNEGWYYKDSKAYRNGGVCYISEYAFENAKPIEINGERFYKASEISEEDLITKDYIMELVDYNERHADSVFEMSEWASVETTYDSLVFEDFEQGE
jgi:hypothetical protein